MSNKIDKDTVNKHNTIINQLVNAVQNNDLTVDELKNHMNTIKAKQKTPINKFVGQELSNIGQRASNVFARQAGGKQASPLDELIKLKGQEFKEAQEERTARKDEIAIREAQNKLDAQDRLRLKFDEQNDNKEDIKEVGDEATSDRVVISPADEPEPSIEPTPVSATSVDTTSKTKPLPTSTSSQKIGTDLEAELGTEPPKKIVQMNSKGEFEEIDNPAFEQYQSRKNKIFEARTQSQKEITTGQQKRFVEQEELAQQALLQIDLSANTFVDNAMSIFNKSGFKPGVTAGMIDKFILTPFNINEVGKAFDGQAPEYGGAILKNIMKGSRSVRGIPLFGKGRPTRWDSIESGIENSATSAQQSLVNYFAQPSDDFDLGVDFKEDPIGWIEARRDVLEEFKRQYKDSLFTAFYLRGAKELLKPETQARVELLIGSGEDNPELQANKLLDQFSK